MTTCEHDCEYCERLAGCPENAAVRFRDECLDTDHGPDPFAALEARIRGLDSDLQDIRAKVETLTDEWHRVLAGIVAATGEGQ